MSTSPVSRVRSRLFKLTAIAIGVTAIVAAAKPSMASARSTPPSHPASAVELSPLASCETAARWADSVDVGRFDSYHEFASLPLVYRRAAYKRLASHQRLMLWQQHLESVTQGRTWSPEQQAYLARVNDSLSVWLSYDTAQAGLAAKEHRRVARTLFGDELATSLFARIGAPDKPVSTDGTAFPSGCSCASGDDWCGGSQHCTSGSCETGGHCGWFLLQDCNGTCSRNS